MGDVMSGLLLAIVIGISSGLGVGLFCVGTEQLAKWRKSKFENRKDDIKCQK